MIKNKRIQSIEQYIRLHKSASLDELMVKFEVSKNTIRRDVQQLVDTGDFIKVYGGVAVNEEKRTKLEHFQDRQIRNKQQKEKIGKLAAAFVEDGDIIFIDSGTTTIEMIKYIQYKEITVITNNLDFIVQAIPYENMNVITAGGILERKTNSFGILKYMDILNAYNINKAFMASTGISLTHDVTNSSPFESELKSSIVNKSSHIYLLVDDHKFDKYGLVTYCSLTKINTLITNAQPPKEYIHYFKKHHIQLVIAE